MKEKYEISLWEDFPDVTINNIPFLNERKICIIGSDNMTTKMRALEPKMITNVNGTHTFTFKMYYSYIDDITGEKIINPFGNLLINERKVKVYWKNEWYDMLIKSLDEDTTTRCITYTCKDLFITELSRNGYNLEFSSELMNNSGTARELTEQVLNGTDWQFDENSTSIYQYNEEAVYEMTVLQSFVAKKMSPDSSDGQLVTIPYGSRILVFYSSINQSNLSYFLYSDDGFITDENDMLVINGNCYEIEYSTSLQNGTVYLLNGSNIIAQNLNADAVSNNYRAKRLVRTQKTTYDMRFNRYVKQYTFKDSTLGADYETIYGYEETQYNDPQTVVNLIANSVDFKNVYGWESKYNISNIQPVLQILPIFTSSSTLDNYDATSYLKFEPNQFYLNSGLCSNQVYLKPSKGNLKTGETGGFRKGEVYIFRAKGAIGDVTDPVQGKIGGGLYLQVRDTPQIIGNNYNWGNIYFLSDKIKINKDNWTYVEVTCRHDCSAEELQNKVLFIYSDENNDTPIYISNIQFFKKEIGQFYSEQKIIEPDEIAIGGVLQTIYKYYRPQTLIKDPEKIEYLYVGQEGGFPSSGQYLAQDTTYEKITTIEAKNSNRFNILQSIAENFECWIRFNIDHDSTGKMTFNQQGLPNKTVKLVEYIGEDLGWSFEYGIDLKNIYRKIVSDNISTKIIVIPNENEYAKDGFCSIARSNLNYSKENFVLNLDYYINQGLLNKDMVNGDLYRTSGNYLGYYYNLHQYNTEYDAIAEEIACRKSELIKEQAQLILLQSKNSALLQEKSTTESDLMALANVTTWSQVQNYAQNHTNNQKVQSLLNSWARVNNEINKITPNLITLTSFVEDMTTYIETQQVVLENKINEIKALHEAFFKKYSRYLQEGTWQGNNYVDDDKYYIDAVDVAYTSSRPQLQYVINVVRLSSLEEYSSKIFDVGDICYIQDKEYFGYQDDKITPYKLKIIISEITSFFDSPEKDIIKVQNYKTQFDDLFQRITATTQSLQYASGSYSKAASVINHDKTLSFDLLQETFDYNKDLVLNATNQSVVWDSTGITVTDDNNSALKVRLTAGGLFTSNDGGLTWKNAVRGDGISADIITAGRINTSEIFIYDGNHKTFRWDSDGITAYSPPTLAGSFNKFVRHDQYGIYGYEGINDFIPNSEDSIWNNARFGFTWKGFFLNVNDIDNIKFSISSEGKKVIVFNGSVLEQRDAVISLTNNNSPKFYVTKQGDAYFNGIIEAAGKIYCTNADSGGNYYSLDMDSYLEMDQTGLKLYVNESATPGDYNYLNKISLGYHKVNNSYAYPFLKLGSGGNSDADGFGLIEKSKFGLYVGEGDVSYTLAGYPSQSNQTQGGLFVRMTGSPGSYVGDLAYVNNVTLDFLPITMSSGNSYVPITQGYAWEPIVNNLTFANFTGAVAVDIVNILNRLSALENS